MQTFFPYDFRDGQKEATEFIGDNIGKKICINASTGFGKTSLILSALLPHIQNGRKIIWVSRTGNETDRPIEELRTINKKFGTKFFGISFRGKKDMCLLIESEQSMNRNHDDVNYFCQVKKKECKFFGKLEKGIFEETMQEGPKSFSEILEFARDQGLCPYYLQQRLLERADLVSINYNQILNEGMTHVVNRFMPFDESFLVVDEAHNLQFISSSMNSKKFSTNSIETAIEESHELSEPDSKFMNKYLTKFRKQLDEECESYGKEDEFDMKRFLENFDRDMLDFIIDTARDYGNKYRLRQVQLGKPPRSSLAHLSQFWMKALNNLETDGVSFIVYRIPDKIKDSIEPKKRNMLEIWDMRSKEVLGEKWNEFQSVVFSSGSLQPVDAFAEVVGLDNYVSQSFDMDYLDDHVKSLIVRGLTTKGQDLSDEAIQAYHSAIDTFVSFLNRNLIIFSSSYRIQDEIISGVKKIADKYGRKIFVEYEGMEGKDANEMLENFRACATSSSKGLMCSTMQGRFSEGIDLPGEELDGVFVVGIPFDSLSLKTKLYLRYYEKIYGKEKGRYYAYTVPALRKVSQSLGRAIRSQDDKVVFVLGDERYLYSKYLNLLPKFIKDTFQISNYEDFEAKLATCARIFNE